MSAALVEAFASALHFKRSAEAIGVGPRAAGDVAENLAAKVQKIVGEMSTEELERVVAALLAAK